MFLFRLPSFCLATALKSRSSKKTWLYQVFSKCKKRMRTKLFYTRLILLRLRLQEQFYSKKQSFFSFSAGQFPHVFLKVGAIYNKTRKKITPWLEFNLIYKVTALLENFVKIGYKLNRPLEKVITKIFENTAALFQTNLIKGAKVKQQEPFALLQDSFLAVLLSRVKSKKGKILHFKRIVFVAFSRYMEVLTTWPALSFFISREFNRLLIIIFRFFAFFKYRYEEHERSWYEDNHPAKFKSYVFYSDVLDFLRWLVLTPYTHMANFKQFVFNLKEEKFRLELQEGLLASFRIFTDNLTASFQKDANRIKIKLLNLNKEYFPDKTKT